MNKGLLACFALAFFYTPGKASAQFNDARAYDNTPVGVSQLELNYTYLRSNASLDPSLAIVGANQGTIGFTQYFGVFDRLAWVVNQELPRIFSVLRVDSAPSRSTYG
jgi:hypothetical protein